MTRRRTRVIFPSAVLGAAVILLSSCDRGMDLLNADKTRLTSVEPVMQLNNAIVNSAFTLTNLECESAIVKQHARLYTGAQACGNFNVDANAGPSNANWNNGYATRLRNLRDALANTEGVPAQTNIHNMSRIWQAYTFMRITDSYGDVPYTEGGLGHRAGNPFPEYDKQEFIYTSPQGILEELANASAALTPTQPVATNALLYAGNVTQWRRLGNSLLLRAAMRLTKVNPGLAQQYVQKAVAGGLMQSNADNAVIIHSSEFRNDPGNSLNGGQSNFNYLVHDFVDHLKQMNDPRLGAIAVRYPNATSAATQNAANAVRDPAQQIGMPMGYDNTTIGPALAPAGVSSLFQFSQPDRQRIMDPQAPTFLVTYAQTQLLLAEAVHRGWVAGSAATHYANGIRAHMQQISTNYTNTSIPQAAIDAYIVAHPLEAGRELEQINTEYWIASFLIADESWANFRRSCFPALTPNPRQDDLTGDERFIRRFSYPSAEQGLNPNVANGVSPDRIDTRIWWDVRVSELC